MKKIFVSITIFLLITLSAFAEDDSNAIYLQAPSVTNINTETQKHYSETVDENSSTAEESNISPENAYYYLNSNPYQSKSTSITKEKKYKNFSFGSKTDYTFSPDKYTNTNTFYGKYEKNRFSLNTSYKNNALTSFSNQNKGTFSFSPEYKLNNHVSLQSIYSTNFLDRNRKNEFVFSLKPFNDDRMNFDIGASQIYSENTAPIRSQLNFSTKFKF